MSQYGSSLYTFKKAFSTTLEGRAWPFEVNLLYDQPRQAKDVRSEGGDRAIWWDPDSDASSDIMLMTAGTKYLDETWTATLIIQSLHPESDGTQAVADQDTDWMLGEVVGALLADPTGGVTNTSAVTIHHAIPVARRVVGGEIAGKAGHGSRIELDIEVEARIYIS